MLLTSFLSLNKRNTQIASIFIFSPILIILIGFRYKVGGDWYTYESMLGVLNNLKNPFLSMGATDPAYGLINYYAPTWWYGNGITFVNTICGTIFILGIAFFCNKQKYPMLSLAIALPYLIIVVGMGYTRQSAAIGFALFAYCFLIENRLKLYLLCVFLGALFHLTEIIMLILLIARVNKKNLIVNTILFFVCFSIALYLLQNSVLSRLATYDSNEVVNSEGGMFRLIINLFPALLFFLNFTKIKNFYNNDIIINCLTILSIGTILLFILSFFTSTLADRLGLYFSILQIAIYPAFICILNKNVRTIFVLFILIGYNLLFLIWILNSSYAQIAWLPYKNYLF